ncbi:hypothetical protein LZ30DRAFT_432288 [Colletotrichum cereale]|nr:hypothetical protein LZ30DRAFT_432288 [Colletotrichum cereale]
MTLVRKVPGSGIVHAQFCERTFDAKKVAVGAASSKRTVKNDPGRKGIVVVSPGARVGVERTVDGRGWRPEESEGEYKGWQLSDSILWARPRRRNSLASRFDENHCTVSSDLDVTFPFPQAWANMQSGYKLGGMLRDVTEPSLCFEAVDLLGAPVVSNWWSR